MSNTANEVRGAYRRYFGGNPATAETSTRDTASALELHGKSLRSLTGQLVELRKGEGPVSLGDLPDDPETLVRRLYPATPQGEPASGIVHTARDLVGGYLVSGPKRLSQDGLDSFDYERLTSMVFHPSGSISQYAVQEFGAGTAELLPHDDRDLREALADLDSLNEEAKEDDLPEPDVEAVANARTLLPRLYAILPVRYRVSPTERRGVAIDAPMKWGASVAVECAPDDAVYCFATIDGNSRRAKFYQMDGLPDVFIKKALRDLAAG